MIFTTIEKLPENFYISELVIGNFENSALIECLAISKTERKNRKSQNHTTTRTRHRISLDLLLIFSSLRFSLLFSSSCLSWSLVLSLIFRLVLSLSLSSFSVSLCLSLADSVCCCVLLLLWCVVSCDVCVCAVWCDTLEKRHRMYRHHARGRF